MENPVLDAKGLSFEAIKTAYGKSVNFRKEFDVNNGGKVFAERKTGGSHKTYYLHIWIHYPNSRKVMYYREQKDGNFKGFLWSN